MHLKQLTLRGFKSFASATTFNFEPGITCVVGPNGSGKSNVVDALAWVMGEQGAKSLRGGAMADVIFAGTTKRAPLGRAEVELTIDNTDGALPIEYAEVTITRTMFRSGGSEYAINGTPARLLDVQELLSDSGIGREMHVIVGQGQLDAILQATPESRRGFIEEAAGVLKHRKRKEKALRKLEATKANLDRLTDLIEELSRQLKPLGRQAETARRAAVIQAEVRDAKARLLADEFVSAQAELAADLADEQAIASAKAQAEAMVQETAAAETAAEEQLRQAGTNFEQAQAHWYGLAGLRERVASTMSVANERARMGESQPELGFSGRDPEALEQEAGEIRRREAELGQQIQQASEALTDATLHRNGVEARNSAAEQTYAAALLAVADRREGMARLTGKVNSIKSRLEASGEEVARLERRRTEALARAEQAEQNCREEEAALADLGATESDLDQVFEQAQALVESREAELAELREAETELANQQAALLARVEALQLAGQRKDGTQELLDAGRSGVVGRLADQLSVHSGYEAAVAAALGPLADAVVVTGLGPALNCLEYLSAEELGWAGIVVQTDSAAKVSSDCLLQHVTAPAGVHAALTRILGNHVVVDDLAAAKKLVASKPATIAVTRVGEVISAWRVEGGGASGQSLLELAAAQAKAEQELAEASTQLEQTSKRGEEAADNLAKAQEAAEAALAKLHVSDAELAAVADRMSQLKQAQTGAAREAERLGEAIAAAQQTREQDETKLGELQTRLAAASDEEATDPDPTERDETAQEARQARQAEMEARLALRTLEEQAKALAGRAEGLVRAASNERAARQQAEAKARRLRQEAEVAEVVVVAATKLAELVDAAKQRASDERDRAEQARREAEADVVTKRHAARAAMTRLDELLRGAHRDELVRIQHQMRIEQLTEKALTELGLEPDQLVADYGPEQLVPIITNPDGSALGEDDPQPEPVPFDRAEQAKRLRRAERNLSVLGRINPLALEEYDAMKTRHGFLAEQLDDLKRTRVDLLDIVAEVDARVKEVFEQAYQDVEVAFKDVFARLFPGGEGKLVLTDPSDLLTTGVDVEARPAGKQVKRLSLLSGGERSLVAVAFLVSLFIARPSPFYILDEVEAALDDANLGRLLEIYEELRANSQLVVITHQKRTMEIADVLYGVSMRGDGISTVVSQRLHEE